MQTGTVLGPALPQSQQRPWNWPLTFHTPSTLWPVPGELSGELWARGWEQEGVARIQGPSETDRKM